MPALMKIKSAYASLPTAERKVADFILEDPQRASLMVINEIAAAAEVSVPSVTRLSKKLGYDGFMSFRVALASGISNPSPLDVEPIRANDPDDVAAEKLLLLVSKCIEDTAKVLDAKKLSNFCDAILNAKRVLVIGKDESGVLADLFARHLTLRGIDANSATERGLSLAYASHLTDEDVVLAFSRSGTTKDVNDTIKAAHANGATCALICSNVTSPVSMLCDYHFCAARVDDIKALSGRETNTAQYALMKVLVYLIEKKTSNKKYR